MNVFCCLEPDCNAPADASSLTIIGHDQDDNPVWVSWVTCCAGHHYMVDVQALEAMQSFAEVEKQERRLGLGGS